MSQDSWCGRLVVLRVQGQGQSVFEMLGWPFKCDIINEPIVPRSIYIFRNVLKLKIDGTVEIRGGHC